MIIKDLNIDWIAKDIATPSVYYGYAEPGTATGSSSWSIRKVTTSGGIDYVYWTNNKQLSYASVWSERTDCFVAPTQSLGITWSISNSQDSFSNTSSIASISWTDLSGVDTYQIKITDQNSVTYNYLHAPFLNTYAISSLTSELNTNSYRFRGTTGMTYSVVVTAINMAGSKQDSATMST